MIKNNVLRKILIFSFILLFVGVIGIQSSGILEKKQGVANETDSTSPETSGNENQDTGAQPTQNEKKTDATDSMIGSFLEKLAVRYPSLKTFGKQMGLNKNTASQMIKNCGNDNIVKVYILILSKVLNL